MENYDPVVLTRLLVFGADTPSSNYNLHIRSGVEPNPAVSFSSKSYMTEGAGRYAYASLFPAIQRFFGASLKPGNYSWAKLAEEVKEGLHKSPGHMLGTSLIA